MEDKYDMVIITNLPAFYKIRLFNEIYRYRTLLVVYTGHQEHGRNKDFYNEEPLFQYVHLSGAIYNKCFAVCKLLSKIKYNELIIGSWDHPVMWTALLYSRRKSSLIVESSVFESATVGIKREMKRIFCSRIKKVYVPGIAQKKLMEKLGYEGEYRVTHGVGIFNYISQPPYTEKTDPVMKFLYVGRLTAVKNLHILIEVFNDMPHLELNIVGFGELEEELKKMSDKNIIFHGAIPNKKLSEFYQSMDVFILPSKSEPWGLVVEEALNNGLPVIASDRVGCKDDLVTEEHGIIFDHKDKDSLKQAINRITDLAYYNSLRENISKLNFENIAQEQIQAYLT